MRKKVSIYLDENFKDKITKISNDNGISLSAYIQIILRKTINNNLDFKKGVKNVVKKPKEEKSSVDPKIEVKSIAEDNQKKNKEELSEADRMLKEIENLNNIK